MHSIHWCSAHDQRPHVAAICARSLAPRNPAVATDAAVGVLATISELLVLLIGGSVATRLLREAWPDDFAGDTTEETVT